jgi:hypothetical protein
MKQYTTSRGDELSQNFRGYRGVKIFHPESTNKPIDRSKYPYKLEIQFRLPEEQVFVYTSLYRIGYRQVIVYGKSAKLLLDFVAHNSLTGQPDFKRYIIFDNNGEIVSSFEH